MKKTCKDCKRTFEHPINKKCEFCNERDQYYKERGIQDELNNRIEEDENVNVN